MKLLDTAMLLLMNEANRCLAKRILRDLRHAVDAVPESDPLKAMLEERYAFFLKAVGNTSDYVMALQFEIRQLENRLAVRDYSEETHL